MASPRWATSPTSSPPPEPPPDWVIGKEWSDRFLPEIKAALGVWLVAEPEVEEDRDRNTDLIVLRMESVRIACRIRKHEYLLQYPDEFTIRAHRPSGAKTELAKIVEGWGQFFFYGFANRAGDGLGAWALCDLNVFRLWFNRYIVTHPGRMPGQ